MGRSVAAAEADPDTHRAVLGAIGAIAAGAFIQFGSSSTAEHDFRLPVGLFLLSFLLLFLAFSIQGLKTWRWVQQVAAAVGESGTLALLLGSFVVLRVLEIPGFVATALGALGVTTWLVVHVAHLRLWAKYLQQLEAVE